MTARLVILHARFGNIQSDQVGRVDLSTNRLRQDWETERPAPTAPCSFLSDKLQPGFAFVFTDLNFRFTKTRTGHTGVLCPGWAVFCFPFCMNYSTFCFPFLSSPHRALTHPVFMWKMVTEENVATSATIFPLLYISGTDTKDDSNISWQVDQSVNKNILIKLERPRIFSPTVCQ